MCRWLAYKGPSIFLDSLVIEPEHSLVAQSLCAEQAATRINADGFGIGWYGARPEPGIYRNVLPAWNDDNLHTLLRQLKSGLFFAHARAAVGAGISAQNCHPFGFGDWLFMHNGKIGNYGAIRRRLETMLPDALFDRRSGDTDSELIFLLMAANGLEDDPIGATERALALVGAMMAEAAIDEPLRFTAALTNGRDFFAFRAASDSEPPSLYFQAEQDRLLVVSEPLDRKLFQWNRVPCDTVLSAREGEPVRLKRFSLECRAAAA